MSLRLDLYRRFQRQFVGPAILPAFKSLRPTMTERFREPPVLSRPAGARIWFHAASAGELESLWSVIELASRAGDEIILTVFSPSAREAVEKLATAISKKPLFISYAPWEGSWQDALQRLKPTHFVSAKYEAWPELWSSLAELGIPLTLVGARKRKSLTLAAQVCKLLGAPLPKLRFALTLESDRAPLEREFPSARFLVCGDPRWDRVFSRLQRGHARARELIEHFSRAPKPWGVLAQIWPEDLEFWSETLVSDWMNTSAPTLWIVPHKIDPHSLRPIEEFLRQKKIDWVRTSALGQATLRSPRVILVDEIGFLTELYAEANWVYIGGGFGAGIHSTLEPAARGIPIACGPHRADRFPETSLLVDSGQLRVIRKKAELQEWLQQLTSLSASRMQWEAQALARQGASVRTFDFLRDFL